MSHNINCDGVYGLCVWKKQLYTTLNTTIQYATIQCQEYAMEYMLCMDMLLSLLMLHSLRIRLYASMC